MIRSPRSASIAVLSLCGFVWVGSFHFASAQSPANGSPPPPAQGSIENKTDKTTENGGTSGQTATPAPPKRPKVITNDDINTGRARHDDGIDRGERDTTPGTGVCDDDCAERARQMTEFGPDRDGEWRFALATARRNLAADRAWPGAYATLDRAVKTYCTFQAQLHATAVPSGNDYGARAERARREKYAEDMGRVLGQTVDNANAQIDRMAQQADENDEPTRAAIMRVLAQRVNESCDP